MVIRRTRAWATETRLKSIKHIRAVGARLGQTRGAASAEHAKEAEANFKYSTFRLATNYTIHSIMLLGIAHDARFMSPLIELFRTFARSRRRCIRWSLVLS